MKKEKSPDRGEPIQGEIRFDEGVYKDIKLSRRQQKVVDLLKTGKHSAADISRILGYCDPRSYVRDLIAKNIWVQSAWVEKEDTRYKVYWLE